MARKAPQSDARPRRVEKFERGIFRIHEASCDGRIGGAKCHCSFEANVYVTRDKKLIRKRFPRLTEARTWREDARGAVRHGKLRAPTRTTVAEAGAALIAGMRTGHIYDRSGKPYKPATIRSYERALRLHLVPDLGRRRLHQLERREVQTLVERMQAEGKAASTIQNILNPLQVICRRALRDGEIAIDPTEGLELPRPRGRRDRIATRQEARELIESLPEPERAFWATAFWGGLRRGELRALRWSDVDLASEPGAIHVRRTWDDEEGEVDAKSEAGMRTVPLTGALRTLIAAHGLLTNRAGGDLVFGRTASEPFTPSTVRSRAMAAWGWKRVPDPAQPRRTVWVKAREDALEPLSPHEARHCAASYLIEAGLNDLELTATIGHSDPRTTKTIYGHLFPDSSATIAAKLDAYLEPETS